MLEIISLVLGPVSTNCYLIADLDSGEAAIIDPAWDGQTILAEAQKRGWKIGQLWYTHAHFDHFGGATELARGLEPAPSVALHAADRLLWEQGGLGNSLGYALSRIPEPTVDLSVTRSLSVGAYRFQVRHAPGHTQGLCIFYCASAGILFSGDLIFHHSIGRTDLPGGDEPTILTSIRDQVYSLPDETTVGEEKVKNPFCST
jgi:hydroxyacylglutathione hydrolase